MSLLHARIESDPQESLLILAASSICGPNALLLGHIEGSLYGIGIASKAIISHSLRELGMELYIALLSIGTAAVLSWIMGRVWIR
jgi:hypothetical protein